MRDRLRRGAVEARGLFIHKGSYPARAILRQEAAADAEVVMVMRGSVISYRRNTRAAIRAGTLVFLPPEQAQVLCAGALGSEVVRVEISYGRLEEFAPLFAQPWTFEKMSLLTFGALPSLLAYELEADDAAHLGAEGLFLAMVARASRSLRAQDEPLSHLLSAIDRNLETADPKTIATAVGRTRPELEAECRRHLGLNLSTLIRTRRLLFARRLLEESLLTISEVVGLSGFCDQAHLTRAFRREFHITPGRYRRLLAKRAGESPAVVKRRSSPAE